MNKIFVLGSINTDLVFELDKLPKKGETIFGNKFLIAPGGKGANQAVACSKQGVNTFMIGSTGDDPLSLMNKQSLIRSGVNCSFLQTINHTTGGVAGILVEHGDNRIILDSGANSIQDINTIKKCILEHAKVGDYLLAQLEIPIHIIKSAFAFAKENGMKTVLNAAPAQSLDQEFLQYVDLLIVNEVELKMLSNKIDVQEGIKYLLKKSVDAILVTIGEKGSIYKDQYNEYKVDAYKVAPIDTTAAGDTYIGAFLSRLIEGKSTKEAMEYATAAATLTIQAMGAQPSIPTKQQVINFLMEEK
jgi:ribokinase